MEPGPVKWGDQIISAKYQVVEMNHTILDCAPWDKVTMVIEKSDGQFQ